MIQHYGQLITEEEMNKMEKDADPTMGSGRCNIFANKLYRESKKYIEDNNLSFKPFRSMTGFNDRLVITNCVDEYISIILNWGYGDAELAVIKMGEDSETYDYTANNYLDIDNKNIERDNSEISDGLKNNEIRYYESSFMDKFDDVMSDIKMILSKMKSYPNEVKTSLE